jgi:hypothetical protein
MPECKCDYCGKFHSVWFTDNEIWNKYSIGYTFLCPTCFILIAEQNGCKTTGWFVTVEERAAALLEGQKPSTNNPQGEICPHFFDDKIQVSENNYQRVATCLCMGKLSPVR